MADAKVKANDGKVGKAKTTKPVPEKVPKLTVDKIEIIRKDLLTNLETIETRICEMEKAWDGIVQGLEHRTTKRYERASKKLGVVRETLKEQAVVDLRNIGKVMTNLNKKVQRGMPAGSVARMRDILDIEEVFKRTTTTLDNIVDDRVHGNLRELQGRLDSIFKARMKAMVDLDKRAKASLETALKATRDIKALVPSSTRDSLKKLSKATRRIYKEVEGFSVKKIRAKKKDLAKLDRTIRDMNKQVAIVLRKWPGAKRPQTPRTSKKAKSRTAKA